MSFEWPGALVGLALLPIMAISYVAALRRRRAYAMRFTNLALLSQVAGRGPGIRRHIPAALFLLGLAALLVCLARPSAVIAVPREQAVVMLVIDVSGSMNATDVQPSRLAAAKRAATSFVDQVPPTTRIGLVSFATASNILVRPTTDRSEVQRAVASLRADGGTAMGDGIQNALDARPSRETSDGVEIGSGTSPAVILLLSDGASTSGRVEPLDAARAAREANVPVFAIALGTANGTVEVPVVGQITRRIPVPPDERTLQQIAEITGGRFFTAPSADELRSVYESLASNVGFVTERQEVTALFAGGAAALMIVCGALSLLWFSRLP